MFEQQRKKQKQHATHTTATTDGDRVEERIGTPNTRRPDMVLSSNLETDSIRMCTNKRRTESDKNKRNEKK